MNATAMELMPRIPAPVGPAIAPGDLAPSSREPAAEAAASLYCVFIDEVLQRGVLDGIDQFLTRDFVEHDATGDHDRDDYLSRIATARSRSSTAVWTIELLTSVGDLIVCHTTVSTPSGVSPIIVSWQHVVVRFAAGKMAECWRICDGLPFS